MNKNNPPLLKLRRVSKISLTIDTTEFGRVVFSLSPPFSSKKLTKMRVLKKSFKVIPQESNKILFYLDDFLKSFKIHNPQSEILNIVIYKGSGSFTGLRTVASVALGLSLAWQVPVKFLLKK